MAPVPAGIRLPTMTFSLSPSRLSSRPLTAASVRTLHVSVLQVDMLTFGDEVLDGLGAVVRLEREAPLVLVVAPETDGSRLLGDNGRLLRTPGLEELRHTRQATSDIARFGALHGHARQ